MSVTVRDWPDTTLAAEVEISLIAVEKAAGEMFTGALVTLRLESVAVRVWAPAVLKVAVNVAVPLMRVGVEGSTDCRSVEVKVGEPE